MDPPPYVQVKPTAGDESILEQQGQLTRNPDRSVTWRVAGPALRNPALEQRDTNGPSLHVRNARNPRQDRDNSSQNTQNSNNRNRNHGNGFNGYGANTSHSPVGPPGFTPNMFLPNSGNSGPGSTASSCGGSNMAQTWTPPPPPNWTPPPPPNWTPPPPPPPSNRPPHQSSIVPSSRYAPYQRPPPPPRQPELTEEEVELLHDNAVSISRVAMHKQLPFEMH
jgi:hypothetical protein